MSTAKDVSRRGSMWTWPIALGIVSAVGLIVGLFSDGGLGDLLGNLLLALPVAACLWWGWLKR